MILTKHFATGFLPCLHLPNGDLLPSFEISLYLIDETHFSHPNRKHRYQTIGDPEKSDGDTDKDVKPRLDSDHETERKWKEQIERDLEGLIKSDNKIESEMSLHCWLAKVAALVSSTVETLINSLNPKILPRSFQPTIPPLSQTLQTLDDISQELIHTADQTSAAKLLDGQCRSSSWLDAMAFGCFLRLIKDERTDDEIKRKLYEGALKEWYSTWSKRLIDVGVAPLEGYQL